MKVLRLLLLEYLYTFSFVCFEIPFLKNCFFAIDFFVDGFLETVLCSLESLCLLCLCDASADTLKISPAIPLNWSLSILLLPVTLLVTSALSNVDDTLVASVFN